MPLPPVAVEIAPPSQQPDLVRALLDACSRAVSPVACVEADEAGAANVSALAIVVWHAEDVRIQVGAKRGERRGDWVNRRVSFAETDEEEDRWTTTGYVVGTLASRFLAAPEQAARVPEPAAAPEPIRAVVPDLPAFDKSSPEPAPAAAADAEGELWVDLGAIAGPLFDRGSWRVGGMLGLAYLSDAWPIFAYSALRMSWRPRGTDNLVASLVEGDLGLGVQLVPASRWTLEASGGAVAEWMRVTLDEPEANRDRHLAPALRARLTLGWRFAEPLSVVGGVGFSWWSHKTQYFRTVNVPTGSERRVIVQQPAVTAELSLGLRGHWR